MVEKLSEKLSENFTLEEFIHSETAIAKKISNKPSAIHKKIMKHTCQYLLEPLRKLLNEKYKEYKGKKVKEVGLKVTSGYRSAKLNAAVGGATTSSHCNGSAADIEAVLTYMNGVKAVLPYNELYEDIKAWVKAEKISVDQLIREKSGNAVWCHVSHHPSGKTKDRRQFLIYEFGMYRLDK